MNTGISHTRAENCNIQIATQLLVRRGMLYRAIGTDRQCIGHILCNPKIKEITVSFHKTLRPFTQLELQAIAAILADYEHEEKHGKKPDPNPDAND